MPPARPRTSPPAAGRARPLRGIHVTTVAQNLPGPVAVARLVSEGASATKIEPPGGDPLRTYCPPWYRALHRGVEVRQFDLKAPAGRQRLDGLLADSQVLVTSQRPSALARLGLAWRQVRRRHPHLRVVEIVGDTRTPESPGHDLTYQATAGVIGSSHPRTLLADLFGADEVVAAVLLLLRQPAPARRVVGLRDTLATAAAPWRLGLTGPADPLGGALPTYRLYETRRGRVAVAALEPHFRDRLYAALGLPDGGDLSARMRERTARQWQRWAASLDLPLVAVTER